ncbi:hypothetical protein VTO42DRAFT_5367 [Malbranchea cinnamomea]
MANTIAPSRYWGTVDSFLNEKIRTTADLDNLEDLLKNLEEQQELQRKQLREAEEILKNASKASNEHAETVYDQTQTFKRSQEDINRRLIHVTQLKDSDEAAQKFEASMNKFRRLDIAKGYMDLLNTVDSLSQQVSKALESSPSLALRPYMQLRKTSSALRAAQPAADGAAPHLVDHVGRITEALRCSIATEYGKNFEMILKEMNWPAQELVLSSDLVEEWTHWCGLLLDLQEPELAAETCVVIGGAERRELPVLLPLEIMVRPLDLRFRYHFSGDKATNRLDKPEYFLSHIVDLVNTHSDFFSTYFQPILAQKLRDSPSNALKAYADSISCYISALFPMLRRKIRAILPQISSQPQLLSHFVHELIKFDNEIRETWDYAPGSNPEETWKGLTWEVLVSQDWFNRWLQVEKDFALHRYQNIIDAADSGEIDYDGVEPGATKPTKAAIRVNDLLETITERYRPLSSFSQKIRFLIDIQITIFDLFHERLHSGLEAYLAMTSAIGRTVQGSSNQPNLEGVAGLERLCRIFGSAEYLEKKMQDWSDDVFFLELWYELQDRIEQNARTGRPVAGPMTVDDVAARTSSVVTHRNVSSRDTSDGALFDETASAYRRLRLRAESMVVSALVSSVQNALKPYSRVSTWASLSAPLDESAPAPSFDISNAARTLSTELSFLSRVVAAAPLRRIVRQLLLSIQTYLWDNVLLRHSFSAIGAAQFAVDVQVICDAVDTVISLEDSEGESERIMQRLKEGVLLLCLPLKSEESDSSGEDVLDLWQAEKRVFESNEGARNVLAQLRIETLSETEARAILERRVELRS